MTYRSLICIYYPHQLLPALVALIHYRQVYLQEPIEQPTLIVLRILGDKKQGKRISKVIQHIVAALPWISIKISYSWKIGLLREYDIPVKWRACFIRFRHKHWGIREIIYAHDVSADFFSQTFTHAFPEAKRICFGDSLGIVYTQNYFTHLRYANSTASFLQKLSTWLKLKRRAWLLPKTNLSPQKAILILPFDPGGDFLSTTTLLIPQKEEVKIALNLISAKLHCFDDFIAQLIDKTDKKIVFFALSNLSESKFASQENEILLYQRIIETHVSEKSLLIIKPHPGSSDSTLKELKKRLEDKHEIYYLSEEYAIYPIELNEKLLTKSSKILSISYTSISIPYLYDKEVIHALTDELIETYFNLSAKKWVREGNQQYLAMIDALKTWAGDRPINCQHNLS